MNHYAGIVLLKRLRDDDLLLSFDLDKNIFALLSLNSLKNIYLYMGIYNI